MSQSARYARYEPENKERKRDSNRDRAREKERALQYARLLGRIFRVNAFNGKSVENAARWALCAVRHIYYIWCCLI